MLGQIHEPEAHKAKTVIQFKYILCVTKSKYCFYLCISKLSHVRNNNKKFTLISHLHFHCVIFQQSSVFLSSLNVYNLNSQFCFYPSPCHEHIFLQMSTLGRCKILHLVYLKTMASFRLQNSFVILM